jgi:stalled ribosome rescue protein Dom34
MVVDPYSYIKKNNMSNQKQFGVWMDTHSATIVGKAIQDGGAIFVVGSVNGEKASPSSSEKNTNNHEQSLRLKFFKEISSYMQNATNVHVTGTGQSQEQFMHYLAATPQFKNTKTNESTSNKMSEEKLIEYMAEKLL